MALKKITCCTDFSENAERAVMTAIEMAEKYKAHLSIIHVLPPVINPMFAEAASILSDKPEESLILKLEEQMRKEYSTKIGDAIEHIFVVLDGHISTEILKYLQKSEADLVVMGAYGLSGMGLVVFGSVTKRVAHKALCSVMIVRNN